MGLASGFPVTRCKARSLGKGSHGPKCLASPLFSPGLAVSRKVQSSGPPWCGHQAAGRCSDSCVCNQCFSITANSMFSSRLLCLPGASHRPRAESLSTWLAGPLWLRGTPCSQSWPQPAAPPRPWAWEDFLQSHASVPTLIPGSTLQSLGKWQSPLFLETWVHSSSKLHCSVDLLCPYRTK